MHVLILPDISYPPDHLPFPREVFAKRISDSGWDITWVMRPSNNQTRNIKQWRNDPVYILNDNDYNVSRSIMRSIKDSSRWLSDIIDISDVDLLYVRNDLAMGIVAKDISKSNTIPYIHRISALKSEGMTEKSIVDKLKKRVGAALRERIFGRADLILTISDEMKYYLHGATNGTPLRVIPTGADTTIDPGSINTTDFVKKFELDRHSTHVLYMGKMDKGRNLPFLIKSFKRAKTQAKSDANLIMMGGTPQEIDVLREFAKKQGVDDSVVFTGWISNPQLVHKGIAFCDVGASPLPPNKLGLRTSAPVKVIEYLNLMTPVVTTAIPDSEKVVNQSGGGIVSSYTEEDFSDNLAQLLDSEPLQESMGVSGRKYVLNNRSYDILSDRVQKEMERLVNAYRQT